MTEPTPPPHPSDDPDPNHPEPEDYPGEVFYPDPDWEHDVTVNDPGTQEDYDPTDHMTAAELDALAAQADAAQEEYEAGLVRDAIRNLSEKTAREYLGRYGDAVDARITACLTEARQLIAAEHPGPALTLAATAFEISIRFLLLRPLVQGAFLSERWAAILAEQVTSGRTAGDRELLPRILRELKVEVTSAMTPSRVPVWSFFVGNLRRRRDRFVHQADPVEVEVAVQAIECAETFRSEVVGAVAKRLGFTLDVTNRWAAIHKGTLGDLEIVEEATAADPFAETKPPVVRPREP